MIVLVMLLGRLIIYYLQTMEFFDFLRKYEYIQKMLMCDICTGFWVYLFLFLMLNEPFFTVPLPYYRVITPMMEAAIATYIMHILVIGWNKRNA